jgi:hypothetical protein
VSDLARRYGTTRTRRWPLLAIAGVLAVAGLAWLVWAIAFQGRPEVTSELVAYDVNAGEHRVDATFTVARRSPEVQASCLLRAFADDHATVGEANVSVGPGADTETTERAAVRTERRATSVELVGCTAPGQKRPR